MASEKKIDQFPDVSNKLKAPTKKSLFERQKAEAEAKRLREEAETKAAYDDFVKSFDDEDEDNFGGGLPPRRDFGGGLGSGATATSGRGGRGGGFGGGRGAGSGPGSLGPPPLGKKRPFEAFSQAPQRREDRGLLAFDDYEDSVPPSRVLKTDEDEDERGRIRDVEEQKAAAKPTLQLANLPPGTSPAVIKALLQPALTIDAVRILPPSGPGVYTERKSMSAIVTLAKDTPANDIDAAVNGLQNRYLGYGYYLNLHRHLSSAAIASSAPIVTLGSATASQPFGAKPVALPSASRGPPAHHQRGFAPPTSYAPTGPGQLSRSGPLLHVSVQPPSDIKQLKLIHKVIESLLTHGPEFEALLMSRSDVQREEKWAWLWDPRSVGGVWYRWRLWEVLTGSQTQRGRGKYLPLFEGSSAWKEPDQPLLFEYTNRLGEFVSDSEYNSSDEDESGDEGARRHGPGSGLAADTSALTDEGKAYLNPLEKAKLTHLLARLPTSTARLRKGDVARVTAFAISHAGRGADEVVAMIISNVEKPFAYTSANPDRIGEKEVSGDDTSTPKLNEIEEQEDTSSASLIGVYIISDILSSSSTSGVRHAWRYRQLFETALKQRKAFESLGRMERKMNWGRLRAEKWKRSVQNLLGMWEGWCVFPAESQEHFAKVFNNPPLTTQEEQEAKEKESATLDKGRSKWKAVEVIPKEQTKEVDAGMIEAAMDEDVDSESMGDVDGEPIDEDVDGEPMNEDIDGQPMNEEDIDGEPMETVKSSPSPPPAPESKSLETPPTIPAKTGSVGQPRRRARAVDMFADSDDEN